MNKSLGDKRNGSSKYSKCTGICEVRESSSVVQRESVLDPFLEAKGETILEITGNMWTFLLKFLIMNLGSHQRRRENFIKSMGMLICTCTPEGKR